MVAESDLSVKKTHFYVMSGRWRHFHLQPFKKDFEKEKTLPIGVFNNKKRQIKGQIIYL